MSGDKYFVIDFIVYNLLLSKNTDVRRHSISVVVTAVVVN
jgi:hypothetical protein